MTDTSQDSYALPSEPASSRDSAGCLRVGGIDYLNSLPLLWQLDGASWAVNGDGTADGHPCRVRIALDHHIPSRLAELLDAGELDVALVPVAAWRGDSDYLIVPDIGISSYGAVESIRLYHRRSLATCRQVALDTSSRTSRLLTRLLFRRLWNREPHFVDASPQEIDAVLSGDMSSGGRLADSDAALLIGDAALLARDAEGWESIDLGTEWTRWTGLPFVYAFWVCRRESLESLGREKLVDCLQHARDAGLSHIEDILRSASLPEGYDVERARRYLHRVIRFHMRADEREGLAQFFRLVREEGLADLDEASLRFLETAPEKAMPQPAASR